MLCKTPTFDGVYGIIFFIILLAHLFAIIVLFIRTSSHMRQMVFAYIFVQGWIVDPYGH